MQSFSGMAEVSTLHGNSQALFFMQVVVVLSYLCNCMLVPERQRSLLRSIAHNLKRLTVQTIIRA